MDSKKQELNELLKAVEAAKKANKSQVTENNKLRLEYEAVLKEKDAAILYVIGEKKKLEAEKERFCERKEDFAHEKELFIAKLKDFDNANKAIIDKLRDLSQRSDDVDAKLKDINSFLSLETETLAKQRKDLEAFNKNLIKKQEELETHGKELQVKEEEVTKRLTLLDSEIAGQKSLSDATKTKHEAINALMETLRAKEAQADRKHTEAQKSLSDIARINNEFEKQKQLIDEEWLRIDCTLRDIERKIEVNNLREQINVEANRRKK